MRKELPEHECVVRLGVIAREPDIFVHIERYDIFEAMKLMRFWGGTYKTRRTIVFRL